MQSQGKLLILEGLSRTGKTSVAKQLESEGWINLSIPNKTLFQYHKIHIPAIYQGMHIAIMETAKRFLRNGKNVCLDRSFVSELAYSKVFNRQTLMDPEGAIEELNDLNMTMVLFDVSHKNYIDRIPHEAKIYSKEIFDTMRNEFDIAFSFSSYAHNRNNSNNTYLTIDTNLVSIKDSINFIKEKLNEKNSNSNRELRAHRLGSG